MLPLASLLRWQRVDPMQASIVCYASLFYRVFARRTLSWAYFVAVVKMEQMQMACLGGRMIGGIVLLKILLISRGFLSISEIVPASSLYSSGWEEVATLFAYFGMQLSQETWVEGDLCQCCCTCCAMRIVFAKFQYTTDDLRSL